MLGYTYFQHNPVLLTQRSECERQGITRRARHGLPKASQNRQGEATLLLGGPISGQAPPSCCCEQGPQGASRIQRERDGDATMGGNDESSSVRRRALINHKRGGQIRGSGGQIPADERVLSRQLRVPCCGAVPTEHRFKRSAGW